ncbi:hypothetical protein ACI77O_30945, partial [Pseudomonas tritici]
TPTSPLSACSLMNGLGQRYVQNENRGQTTITAKTYIGGLTPIFSKDNMGAGACIGNACRGLSDGEKVRIKVVG